MNIDISKYIEMLRSYVSLLIPGVIALIGVGLFVPTHLMSRNLQSMIKKDSISQGKKLGSLISGAVSSRQWEQEQAYQQQHVVDANTIESLARQTTLRSLLSYDIFPKPKDDSVMVYHSFGDQYCSSIREQINGLSGGSCPSKAELAQATKTLNTRRYRKYGGASQVSSTIEEGLCLERADKYSLYVDPAYLSGYVFWQNYDYSEVSSEEEILRDCWYSQLAYWIIEDVFSTVRVLNKDKVLNKDSESVFTSAVKRLASISFKRQGINWKFPPPKKKVAKKETIDKVAYVLSPKNMIMRSYTKRVSDDVYDVVHFKVVVVLRAEVVLEFMKELCSSKSHEFSGWDGSGPVENFKHNQISVLSYEVTPVDRLAGEHKLYRYGEDAVVELELTCEYLLDRTAYDSVKSVAVKTEVSEIKAKSKKKAGTTYRR